jgi:hypothetical protein
MGPYPSALFLAKLIPFPLMEISGLAARAEVQVLSLRVQVTTPQSLGSMNL